MRAKTIGGVLSSLLLLLVVAIGCTSHKASVPNVKERVSGALTAAGFKDLTVDVNNDKELITLKGDVKTQADKDRAEQAAKSVSDGFVVSNEIGVRPDGVESAARNIDKNVDEAIEKNFKAVLIANHMDNDHIRYSAKNGVLTLKGNVDSADTRQHAEQLAATVPNVQQVVNELDIRGARNGSKPAPGE